MNTSIWVLLRVKDLSRTYGQNFEYYFCDEAKTHYVKVLSEKFYNNFVFKYHLDKLEKKFVQLRTGEELSFFLNNSEHGYIKKPYQIIKDGECSEKK